MAYDCVEKMIYWSDITQPSISRAVMQGGTVSALINTDLGSPEGIAIDHLSRNMYWTDSILDRIEVSRLDGSHRRVLFDNDLINPRPIIADPTYGYNPAECIKQKSFFKSKNKINRFFTDICTGPTGTETGRRSSAPTWTAPTGQFW